METKPTPGRKRIITSFEIGDLKGPWDAYCAANDVTSGDALCQVIQKLTGADACKMPQAAKEPGSGYISRPPRYYRQMPSPEAGKRSRLYLYLTHSERGAIEERAKADGFGHPNKWVVSLIRARLTGEPQFGNQEIEILRESNQQMLAIGRNLNQIAHAMNASRGTSGEYDAELARKLATSIKQHVQKVGEAMRASFSRWRLG